MTYDCLELLFGQPLKRCSLSDIHVSSEANTEIVDLSASCSGLVINTK